MVDTPEGLKEINSLKVGDKILCCNPNLQYEEGEITSIEEIEVPSAVEITTTDGLTIIAAADQKFFVTHKWVQANQLTLEDILLKRDNTFVGITSIRHLQTPTTLLFITIDKNPTYWAAENGVLVHNGAIGAAVGTILGATAVQGIYWGFTGVLTWLSGPAAPVVVGVWCYWTTAPLVVATHTAALATGLTFAVATGPV